MTDLWTMAGEEAERDAAAHKLALARVACANYWPVLASAGTKDEYEHAKALISDGVTTSVASVAVSPADQAILASRVLDSFDEDWDAHQAARTAVVEDAPGYGQQMGFGFPAEPLPNEAPELENEIAGWEGSDREQRVNMGNGIGVADDSSGPNVEGPGQNQGEDPLLHASALDIEAGLEPGDYRLDAFGALIPVEAAANYDSQCPLCDERIHSKDYAFDEDSNGASVTHPGVIHSRPSGHPDLEKAKTPIMKRRKTSVFHTAPGGGEHAPYYVRREGDKYKVVNRNGDVKGTFNTKEEARSQQKALYANVPGASEEAEKRHGETPKAVEEEGKKASLQLTALQRQAIQVARNMVDQMPAGVEHHAVAKAMYMRAKGFDLDEAETDLVINAALERINERLDFTKEGAYDNLAGDLHRMNHGDRSRYESEGHAFEVSYHERPAYGDMGQPVPKSDKYSGTTGEYTLYHPHGQAQEFHVGPSVHAKGYQAEKVRDTMMDTWSRKKMDRLMSQGNLHTADGVSEEKRDRAESSGDTLPGTDKFPITNKTDLENAKHDIGRTNEPHDKVVNYINRKADELGAPKVGEEKTSRMRRLWAKVTGRRITAVNIHHFDSSGGSYDRTQTDDSIKDGDVFHIPSEKITGYMHAAWPVAVTESKGQFHGLTDPHRPPAGEEDRTCPSCGGSGQAESTANAPYRKPGDTTCWGCGGKGYYPGDPPERVAQWHEGWSQARDLAQQKGYPLDSGTHEASRRTAQGDMSNPMDPSSTGNPFSPAQDVNSAMTDQNPTMGAGAGAGGAMSPNTAPPDEIPGQTQPGSATGTAASSKPRTKPSENPNAPNKPRPMQPQGMPMTMPGQMMTGMPMMGVRVPTPPDHKRHIQWLMHQYALNPDEAEEEAQRRYQSYPDTQKQWGAKPEDISTGPNRDFTNPISDQNEKYGPKVSSKAQVIIAESILENNPDLSDEEALHLAIKTIERYPHVVKEAYGGSDYPFDSATGGYSVCSQCGVEAFDSRTGHCHNCGYVAGAGRVGFDPLVGPTTIRPGRADLRNPGLR